MPKSAPIQAQGAIQNEIKDITFIWSPDAPVKPYKKPEFYKLTVFCRTFPSKKNSKQMVWLKQQRRSVILSSNEYAAWEKSAIIQVKEWMQDQKVKHKVKFPLNAVALHTIFYYPDLRVRDNSNANEGINDVLVKCGVIQDDCWTLLNPTKQTGRLSRDKPRIELYFSYPEPDSK